MSSLSRFFKGKDSVPVQVEKSKENLEQTKQLLVKKSEFLEKKVGEALQTAKKYGLNNKRLALKALREKKRAEEQLKKVDGSIQILESQIDALYNVQMDNEVLKSLKISADSMKSVNRNVKLGQVTEMLDDIREQQDIAREISDVISDPTGFGNAYDDDELLAELEALQEESLEDNLLNVEELPSVPAVDLPEPGTSKPEKTNVDQSLNDLMEWAS